MTHDREEFRSMDDDEVWKVEVIPIEDDPTESDLASYKHHKIMELNCLYPDGYNLNTGLKSSQAAKVKTSNSIKEHWKNRKEQG